MSGLKVNNIPIPVPVTKGGTSSNTAADAAEALGVGATDTPTFAGVNLGNEDLDDYDEGTFTPTVTLVGGAGNTVPVYTTNIGRYTRIGRIVTAQYQIEGDGGAEGAGSGIINLALPFTSAASPTVQYMSTGVVLRQAGIWLQPLVVLSGGASTMALAYFDAISTIADVTGDLQNNTTRGLYFNIVYEV